MRTTIRSAIGATCALFIALGLAGCTTPGSGGGQSTATGSSAPSTASTVKEIQDAIAADADLKGQDIKVSEQAGTINLDGKVSSIAAKEKAETIVRQVQGKHKLEPALMNNLQPPDTGTSSEGGAQGGNH